MSIRFVLQELAHRIEVYSELFGNSRPGFVCPFPPIVRPKSFPLKYIPKYGLFGALPGNHGGKIAGIDIFCDGRSTRPVGRHRAKRDFVGSPTANRQNTPFLFSGYCFSTD